MRFKVVIPARYASRRLPAKPLLSVAGKPLLQHAYECARDSNAEEVVIATDDRRIAAYARCLHADCCIIQQALTNGTERVACVARVRGWSSDTMVINLQGDEPCISAQDINLLAEKLSVSDMNTAVTLFVRQPNNLQEHNQNLVCVACGSDNRALYFSRFPIPFGSDFRAVHLGIYGYCVILLEQYLKWGVSECEHFENLEQLRMLSNGRKISAFEATSSFAVSINAREDVPHAESVMMSCTP